MPTTCAAWISARLQLPTLDTLTSIRELAPAPQRASLAIKSGMKLFERKVDPKEQVRNSKREITKGSRDLQRELVLLQREEAKLVVDIKKAAKQNNSQATKTLAKSLVRLRAQQNQLRASDAHLRGVRTAVTTSTATQAVVQSMDTAAKAMAAVGKVNDPAATQKTMQQFQRENARAEMAGEMMDDALDDIFDSEAVEGETDEVINEVLDSIGVDLSAQLGSAPKTRLAAAAAPSRPQKETDDELVNRLAALK